MSAEEGIRTASIPESTWWFIALQIVFVVFFACSSKDPVEPTNGISPATK
jgi:hypothetical protein